MIKEISTFSSRKSLNWYGRESLPKEFSEVEELLEQIQAKNAVMVELGCGKGGLKEIHLNYVGLDISLFALKKYLNGKKAIQADMQMLPFKNDSADFIFSIASVEHVACPEKVFAEVDRVLKKDGIAYLFPAWFCRPWAAKGLPVKRYCELSFADRIIKFFIPIRNHIIWRGLSVIPRRMFRESLYFVFPRQLLFRYNRLRPNLKEYICSDCDAFSCMDPHMAILYFYSRSYEILDGGGKLFCRIFYRNKPVIVRKTSR